MKKNSKFILTPILKLIQDAETAIHPEINLEPIEKIQKREGNCFELSFKLALNNPTWMLVHAEILDGVTRIHHAYLKKEGAVYDPVLNKFFDENKLYQYWRPSNYFEYSIVEAGVLLLKNHHYGPWMGD